MALARFPVLISILVLVLSSCSNSKTASPGAPIPRTAVATDIHSPQIRKLIDSAVDQTRTTRGYTQDYFTIGYPNGDVPAETGACTDVIIRSFRRAGIDLQKEVHEDMLSNFSAYPRKWGLTATDKNIDHRRVPNLQTYFTRKGKSLPPSLVSESYRSGDVVSWDIDGKGMTHIGLVSNLKDEDSGRYLIIHNIGGGVNAEDRLFSWKITGHFRYF